jgi:hypothetical protein
MILWRDNNIAEQRPAKLATWHHDESKREQATELPAGAGGSQGAGRDRRNYHAEAVLALCYGLDYKFERLQVLLFGYQNRVARSEPKGCRRPN